MRRNVYNNFTVIQNLILFGYSRFGWGRSFFSHPCIWLPLLYWYHALSLTSLPFIWHWSELKADNENIWSNGDDAQYWTIKNTEAQHVAIIEDEGNWWRAVWWVELRIAASPGCRGNTARCRERDEFHCCCAEGVRLYAPSGPSISSSFSFQHLSDALNRTTITKLSSNCSLLQNVWQIPRLSLAITHSILAVRDLGLSGMLSNSSSKEPALDKLNKGLMNSSSSHTWKAFFRAVDRENLN